MLAVAGCRQGNVAVPRGHLDRLDVETGDSEVKDNLTPQPEKSRMMETWLPVGEQDGELSLGHLPCWISEGQASEVTETQPHCFCPREEPHLHTADESGEGGYFSRA